MTSTNSTINEAPVLRSSSANPAIPQIGSSRPVPVLPPKPVTGNYSLPISNYSHMPYSGYGYGNGYSSMGYQSPMYNSYGYGNSYSYGNHGMYGLDNYSNYGPRDDAERRFIQFAEESSRNTFASVESVVRAVSSISMMLDNTLFAMTSSFRAILSVAENFGRLRSLFGHIWYSLNVFRLFRWLHRKFMLLMGYKVMNNAANKAWRDAYVKDAASKPAGGGGFNWPIVAFFGVIISAPYLISKFFLPKCEDRYNPEKWKTPGVKVKAAFDFRATSHSELSLRVNDELLLAPTYIQEEMKLTNTGWAFAVGNGKSGLIPLNYIVLSKRVNNGGVLKNSYSYNNNNNNLSNYNEELPTIENKALSKNNIKRVSFGENQIIESNGMERIVKIPDTDSSTSTTSENTAEVLCDKEGANEADEELNKAYTDTN